LFMTKVLNIFLTVLFIIGSIFVTVNGQAFAASSANYIISTEVIAGSYGGAQTSASYSLEGLSRDHEYITTVETSALYKMAGGFFNAIFGDLIQNPIITSVSPNAGPNNDSSFFVSIYGLNFQSGATTKLTKSLESDISGESVTFISSGQINCTFDLAGKALGSWNVVLTNPDARVSTLAGGFTITQPEGKPIITDVMNVPNPFNPDVEPAQIKYHLDRPAQITVSIYNIKGERIWTQSFSPGSMGGKGGAGAAGDNTVLWTGVHSNIPRSVPNGAYVYVILYNNSQVLGKGGIFLFR